MGALTRDAHTYTVTVPPHQDLWSGVRVHILLQEIQTYGMMYSENSVSFIHVPASSLPSQTYSPYSSSYVHVCLSYTLYTFYTDGN